MKVDDIENILADEWRNAGIHAGDTILLHSSIKKTYKRYLRLGYKISALNIVNSFLKALGDKGTLVVPLFNFDFCKGIKFDFLNTPSQMGAISEAARKHKESIRTGHPVYSFCAIGFKAKVFNGIDNYFAYGSGSPFEILHEMNCKIAVLDLPENSSMTFYHYVEEIMRVNYRYHKEFSGEYVNSNGVSENRTYDIFVRDLENRIETDVEPCGRLLIDNGSYKYDSEIGLRVIEASVFVDFVKEIILSGNAKNILYKVA